MILCTKVKVEDLWPGDVLEMEQGIRRRVVDVRECSLSVLDCDTELVLREGDDYLVIWPCNQRETIWKVR